jgi:hypothetical protein
MLTFFTVSLTLMSTSDMGLVFRVKKTTVVIVAVVVVELVVAEICESVVFSFNINSMTVTAPPIMITDTRITMITILLAADVKLQLKL